MKKLFCLLSFIAMSLFGTALSASTEEKKALTMGSMATYNLFNTRFDQREIALIDAIPLALAGHLLKNGANFKEAGIYAKAVKDNLTELRNKKVYSFKNSDIAVLLTASVNLVEIMPQAKKFKKTLATVREALPALFVGIDEIYKKNDNSYEIFLESTSYSYKFIRDNIGNAYYYSQKNKEVANNLIASLGSSINFNLGLDLKASFDENKARNQNFFSLMDAKDIVKYLSENTSNTQKFEAEIKKEFKAINTKLDANNTLLAKIRSESNLSTQAKLKAEQIETANFIANSEGLLEFFMSFTTSDRQRASINFTMKGIELAKLASSSEAKGAQIAMASANMGLAIITMMSQPQASSDSIIINQLNAIKDYLVDFRKEINDRLENIDTNIARSTKYILKAIENNSQNISSEVNSIRGQVGSIYSKLNVFYDEFITSEYDQQVTQRLLTIVADCKIDLNISIDYKQYQKCVEDFYKFAVVTSVSQAAMDQTYTFSGSQQLTNFPFDSNLPRSRYIRSSATWANGIAKSPLKLPISTPNPEIMAAGIDGIRRLQEKYPNFSKKNAKSEKQMLIKIKDSGMKTVETLRSLTSSEVVYGLFDEYVKSVKSLFKQYSESKRKFEKENFAGIGEWPFDVFGSAYQFNSYTTKPIGIEIDRPTACREDSNNTVIFRDDTQRWFGSFQSVLNQLFVRKALGTFQYTSLSFDIWRQQFEKYHSDKGISDAKISGYWDKYAKSNKITACYITQWTSSNIRMNELRVTGAAISFPDVYYVLLAPISNTLLSDKSKLFPKIKLQRQDKQLSENNIDLLNKLSERNNVIVLEPIRCNFDKCKSVKVFGNDGERDYILYATDLANFENWMLTYDFKGLFSAINDYSTSIVARDYITPSIHFASPAKFRLGEYVIADTYSQDDVIKLRRKYKESLLSELSNPTSQIGKNLLYIDSLRRLMYFILLYSNEGDEALFETMFDAETLLPGSSEVIKLFKEQISLTDNEAKINTHDLDLSIRGFISIDQIVEQKNSKAYIFESIMKGLP
ncbi:hypothetical protein [Deinococcus knuensis]|uniref:Uncharacterized protein n=1 Tax=Deinococcus knuensis TaxID=1837380 RepID=A0ABQ2T1D7_9DEIO|nr:hypothetical protein [Deinococcus knuensis]GGS44562.1 hypothetical protein GCM10008961_39180 [Deinococcus knuensis]